LAQTVPCGAHLSGIALHSGSAPSAGAHKAPSSRRFYKNQAAAFFFAMAQGPVFSLQLSRVALLFSCFCGSPGLAAAGVLRRGLRQETSLAQQSLAPEKRNVGPKDLPVGNNKTDASNAPEGVKVESNASEGVKVQNDHVATASFNSTPAQDAQLCPMLKMQQDMYLTAVGSLFTGQWGTWQMSDDRDGIATATWGQNFLSASWQTVSIATDAGKPALSVKLVTTGELEETFGWVVLAEGQPSFSFMNTLLAPDYATGYNLMNYTVAPGASGDPSVMGVIPLIREQAFPDPVWQHFAVTDCEGNLVSVLRLEDANGTSPGRGDIFDSKGVLAAQTLPDPLVARYQFIDANQHLLATAEAASLNLNISLKDMPKNPVLGNILPYAVHFELGGYNGSSTLIHEDYRWIIAAAIQLRALMDAHAGWTPPLLANRMLLLSVALAVGLILLVLLLAVCLKAVSGLSGIGQKDSAPVFRPVYTHPPSMKQV